MHDGVRRDRLVTTPVGLLDILLAAAREAPDQVIVHVDAEGDEHPQTHRDLLHDALCVAGGLSATGLAAGTPVIVLPGGGADFLASFWGSLAAGLVPVPMAAAPTRLYAVWSHLDHPPVIVDAVVEPLLMAAMGAIPSTVGETALPDLLNVAHLRSSAPIAATHLPDPHDLAFLQFSSGSTSAPKGVELTHANVLVNIEQARATGAVTPGDVIVSWLPYFHDMGLIGAHLTPLSAQIKQVKLDPVDFGKRPALWYETAQRHQATLLPMAGFALAVTTHRVPAKDVAALDLRSVRLVGVGAEPISARMWRDFIEHMAPSGLDPTALAPLYGLAEATVAVAFPPAHELAQPICLDRRALAEGLAVDMDPDHAFAAHQEGGLGPAEFMDVGFAVTGGELRIVNEDGDQVADSVVGEIHFRGPNVARGYYRRPQETAETFVDGWLRTGDLGFMRSGRLCVTGRVKDVLFISGQKFHAHDIEQIVSSTPGAPTGRVAVVGMSDPAGGSEHVAVFVSSRGASIEALRSALLVVRARVREALAHADVSVYPIAAADFPRTTSGKIQRAALRELLAGGAFTSLADEVATVCADAAGHHTLPRSSDSTPKTPSRSRSETQATVTDIWARVLKVPADTIGTQDRFLAIGGSSLTAMQVLGELETTFGGRLSPAILSRCATVAALTDHFLDRPPVETDVAGIAAIARPTHTDDLPAIISMACRFPDADTPEAFWDNLIEGRDSVTEVPISRWTSPASGAPRWGAFLDDVGGFDADYFGISSDEAVVMDPHARIFLEVAHEALERAGYAGERRTGRRVGIFVAIGESHYPELLREAIDHGFAPSAAALTGNLRSLVAARISHHLDLTGPAMVVDTACSSALVALHLARRSLESGECDLVVVGGVHLNLTDTAYTLLEAAQALSPTGRCRTFSGDADGFVPGEGAAAIVLEPVATAHAAGDPVLAVVRGSATNNDGRSLSLMAPNPLLQEAVITAAYADAHLDPATVSYVEAHGTGTAVGDPIEIRSLMRTFPATTDPRWLGSVKTNIGHLLNTAGMPSLLKVILQLQHHHLAPSLHYGEPSPQFDLASARFTVASEPQPWDSPSPLRAGINGFGFGGTNAHVILEEAPEPPALLHEAEPRQRPHLLTLSAASDDALRAAATDLATYVRQHPDLNERDVCRCASTARDDAPHRLALVVADDLADQLESAATRPTVGVVTGRRPRVVFLFPGHDSPQPSLAAKRLVAAGISLANQLHEWGIEPDVVLRRDSAPATGGSDLTTTFGPQVQGLLDDGYDTFVEMGPASSLSQMIRANAPETSGGRSTLVVPLLGDASDPGVALVGAVGQLWAHGVRITRPDTRSRHPRVPVPTYPFQRVHYWLPEIFKGSSTTPPASTSLLHSFGWDESPLPAGSPLRSVAIVGVDDEVADGLTRRLIRRGVEVHRASNGDLLDYPSASAVIFLAGSPDLGDAAYPQGVPPPVLSTMLGVCRQLGERPTSLVLVTADVAVTGAVVERPRPGQAVLAGLAMALPQENPQQGVRIVDLSSLDDTADHLDALVRELDARPQPGPAESVAWRKGQRLTLSPRLGKALAQNRKEPLPVDGRYLITGGTGGIGAEVARALARRGHPEIVLAGRRPKGPVALLDELTSLGATAHYVSADLSVPDDVDRLVSRLPTIDGLFHAAGVATLGGLRSAQVSDVETVLAPKVIGTVLLARALHRYGRRPDTFVLFSSISSALPGYAGGLGSYTAANAFLDAFAASESAAGRPVQSLNFAAVTDTGMASGATFAAAAATTRMPQVSRQQAVEALFEATTLAEPRLLVMDATVTAAASTEPKTATPTDPPHTPKPRSAMSPSESVRDLLARLIGPEIGQRPDEIDDEASLLTMGLDSLTAVDLVKTLEQELSTSLPTTLLFEYPSIAQLSAYLASQHPTATPAPPAAESEAPDFALAPVQTAFHTMGRLHPDVPAYACVRLMIEGDLDQDFLARSLSMLDERHPMLRMRMRGIGNQARQVIEPAALTAWPAWFEVRDLTGSIENAEDALSNYLFSLETEAPIRATLLRESDGQAHLVLVLHHAAGDGSSLNLVCEEMWQVYSALSRGAEPDLPPLRSHFRDHVRLAADSRKSESFAADTAYWQQRLARSEARHRASLPVDDAAVADPLQPLKARQRMISVAATSGLRQRAADLDVSLFHLVLSAYVRQLSRSFGQGEVTVNVARAGRDARLPDINRLVGSFADTLPLTVTVDSSDDAGTLPRAVRDAWLDTMKHATLTTLDLARLLPALDASPRTAGDASFSFSRFPIDVPTDCPIQVTATAARTASAATRLGLVCWEFDGVLQFSWNYPASLFAHRGIDAFADAFVADLASLVAPRTGAAESDGIARRVHRQCLRTPHSCAVQFGDSSTSYGELDRAATVVARRLQVAGVVARDRVALLTEPGPTSVIGLLGILYAGATWVPLDVRHPLPRLSDQASRCRTTAVVADQATRPVAEQLAAGCVVDVVGADALDAQDHLPDLGTLTVAPSDDAYIIFTSGTTGRPKGIPITHRAITTYLDWAIATFGYAEGDRMAATASLCFDASVRQLLAPLLVGATVVVIAGDTLRDPATLLAEVEERGVTVWSSVPTLWGELLRAAERRHTQTGVAPDLSALRWVHTGGEALSPGQVRRWFDLFGAGHRIANLYGPTEATINASFEVIDARPDDEVTTIAIGRPVATTLVQVMGLDAVECAPGVVGELWISGPGLTAGYVDDPELTALAFVERAGRRYYRSGDRGRLRGDGKLEFLGRLDQQVNLAGHRVEPAEIETVLHTHDGVERASVVMDEAPQGAPRLVAYVQARCTSLATSDLAGELRDYLAGRVPYYMVPAQIRLVETMPLTPIGKVDTSLLRASSSKPVERVGEPLTTPTQHVIAQIWRDITCVDKVYADDDFFALGGDSIAVLEVFARLEPHCADLPAPTALYRHRVLADLARVIDATGKAPVDPSQPDSPTPDGYADAPFPLTPAQRGFVLAEALSPQARSSWVSCLRLDGPLEPGVFQRAVDALVARHLMLRMHLDADQRPPTQREVPGPATIKVVCETITPDDLAERVAKERAYRFDLSQWPLLRLSLFELGVDEFALVVHGHHAVADGYSVALLIQELEAIYDGLASRKPVELPPLRSTFRDYAALVTASHDHPGASPSLLPATDLPAYIAPRLRPTRDMSGDDVSGEAGADRPVSAAPKSTFALDARSTAALTRRAVKTGTTPYAPFLTAFYRALCGVTNQHDLVLGVATTGRDYALPDVTRIVGPCAHLLPVRVTDPRATFDEQLSHISDAVTAARESGTSMHHTASTGPGDGIAPPMGAQFVFSYLDFRSRGQIESETLTVAWDREGGDLEPPPLGTDLFFAARPDGDGVQCTLRASAGVMTATGCDDLAAAIREELMTAAQTSQISKRLDAAIIGYLPAPADVMAAIGLAPSAASREAIRARIFPDGQPRLLEEVCTPLGVSGFVALPIFADELAGRGHDALSRDVALAVGFATASGARCVSLAGMIPSHTAYGLGVLEHLDADSASVSTGHAATAVSVVKTVVAALDQTGRGLAESTVAFVGIGSIGRSALDLLLAKVGSPKALILCDVTSRIRHLDALTQGLAAAGYPGQLTIACSDSSVGAAVYSADLIVAAISGGHQSLDIERLRPGTIVVDDSFPHCFDVAAARARMADHGDVLVVGGGLLDCGPITRIVPDGILPQTQMSAVMSDRLPDTIASCQLESLLRADRPQCPVVHGLVSPTLAATYWEELRKAEVRAAPLHLLGDAIPAAYVEALRRC